MERRISQRITSESHRNNDNNIRMYVEDYENICMYICVYISTWLDLEKVEFNLNHANISHSSFIPIERSLWIFHIAEILNRSIT